MPRPRLLTFPHSDPLHEHNLVRMRAYLTGHPEVADVTLSGQALRVTFVDDEAPLGDTVLDRMPWEETPGEVDPLGRTPTESIPRALARLRAGREILQGPSGQAEEVTGQVARTMRETLRRSPLGANLALPRMRDLVDRTSLARQMFQVQELPPPGAVPFYERDPDLASFFEPARGPMRDPEENREFLTGEMNLAPLTGVLREPGPERTAYDHLNEDCQS